MFDFDALTACLDELGLGHWNEALVPVLHDRLTGKTHGDWARWNAAIAALPAARGDTERLRDLLMELHPWRKGHLQLDDVRIDTEWRSDWKWSRLSDAIEPLDGRAVLDVGSGNGYYALEMRKAGAAVVIGVDPTLLFAMQFLAINVFARDDGVFILPCRLEETPPAHHAFDTTFSMGVLYHQRDHQAHLRDLGATLRPGGQLVLETLFLPGENVHAATPPARYARMRNVWSLPTVPQLVRWLEEAGYRVIEKRITRDEVYIADEAFFTGTAAEVTPIREVDNRAIGHGGRGPITERLQSQYFDLVHGRLEGYADWLTVV